MVGIEKIVANSIQVASQAIHKSGGIIQSTTKPIENGSEKLTGALSGLATNNSTLANKTSTSQQLAIMKPIIKPIETDEEYIKIMNKLFNDQRYDNR